MFVTYSKHSSETPRFFLNCIKDKSSSSVKWLFLISGYYIKLYHPTYYIYKISKYGLRNLRKYLRNRLGNTSTSLKLPSVFTTESFSKSLLNHELELEFLLILISSNSSPTFTNFRIVNTFITLFPGTSYSSTPLTDRTV